ncbi:MAG: SUF system NifU family Fe-S cluster assembly protein [Coxiellaceae bacterium]|nr:SUF system NifU family Fe-S cluster assembly protein [Coxiellaceae bacterium]
MADLRDLYQQLIIDHGRHPRNKRHMVEANHRQVGNNPLCGDKLVVYVQERGGVIEDVSFEGEGCAISVASASLMTEALKGKTLTQAQQLFQQFHQMTTTDGAVDEDEMGKLAVLSGVRDYPMRVKCATLCWHTIDAALHDQADEVSTE